MLSEHGSCRMREKFTCEGWWLDLAIVGFDHENLLEV